MFSVSFTREARVELIEAEDWYEGELSGLGRRFRRAVDEVVERMSANPRKFPVVYKNVHRALLHRFPYSLFFVIDGESLLIIACFHASRNPKHWQSRSGLSPD
ncbi:MAG: type II toxin-antitoxin system RelE/ParE family toxin [Acidobacteria bacterium]|nr:type II toxin-antitoxin system RelE/ParE family toxin [Acidobacteriota bacterium]